MSAPKIHELAQYYVTLLDSLKVALGVDFVFFGDQSLIPGGVTICIEPDKKVNTLSSAAAARGIIRQYSIYIFVYCTKLADQHANRNLADQVAEAVEAEIFARPTCGGITYNTFVTAVESGYVPKNNTPVAATRLTVTSEKKEYLPNPVE